MKKLNITKEQFNRSRYFQKKYGTLEYVSESGKVYKTSKGNLIRFNESIEDIRNRSKNARNSMLKEITNSEKFKEVIERLEDKIGKAADNGKQFAADVIDTSWGPCSNELFFQAVCKYFQDNGFEVVQHRCPDGFGLRDHYDICWDD